MKSMKRNFRRVLTVLCAFVMVAVCVAPAAAQNEVKEKPPMYTYVGNWAIPRGQWGEMEKANTADQPIYDKAFSAGTIVGYGNDVTIVHQGDGQTHDEWWSAMSMAGLLNVLDQFYKSGSAASPVLSSATKHWDDVYVSRYYNWHGGSWKGIYTRGASYKLKADAPPDALDMLSKTLIVPFLEKLLADGTIHEYEIDTEAIHTEASGTFTVVFITSSAEALDKVEAALVATIKGNPLAGPAFISMLETSAHRDFLVRTNATYK
jgi:hypothetical protein